MSKYAIADWTDTDCSQVESVFKKMEGKYTLLLLAVFGLEGEQSFGVLKRGLGMNTKTLSARLRSLEENGLIKKRIVTEGNIKKSYYSLACSEVALLNILKAFRAFSKVSS